jgi:hypothetical protein
MIIQRVIIKQESSAEKAMKKLISIALMLALSIIAGEIYAAAPEISIADTRPAVSSEYFNEEFDFRSYITGAEVDRSTLNELINMTMAPEEVSIDFRGYIESCDPDISGLPEPAAGDDVIGAIDFEKYIIEFCRRPTNEAFDYKYAEEIIIRNLN